MRVLARSRAALADAGDAPRDRFVALVENILIYMVHRRYRARSGAVVTPWNATGEDDSVRLGGAGDLR